MATGPVGSDSLLSTTLSNQSGRCYHLTVERLAPKKWEWLAWRADDAMGQVVQRGVTSSSDTAMVAAEDAVVTLEIVAAAGQPKPSKAASCTPNCPRKLGKNTNGGDIGEVSLPTELDFSTPIVNGSNIELIYEPTGGRYTFTLVGRGLSPDKPRVVQNHGMSPQWGS